MMKKLIFSLITYMMLTTVVWGHDAMYFYNQGVQSSLANRKIEPMDSEGIGIIPEYFTLVNR